MQLEAFTDQALLTLADVSGASDNTLRKMHASVRPRLLSCWRQCVCSMDTAAAAVIECWKALNPLMSCTCMRCR